MCLELHKVRIEFSDQYSVKRQPTNNWLKIITMILISLLSTIDLILLLYKLIFLYRKTDVINQTTKPPVIIAGAGIGGLTMAHRDPVQPGYTDQ